MPGYGANPLLSKERRLFEVGISAPPSHWRLLCEADLS